MNFCYTVVVVEFFGQFLHQPSLWYNQHVYFIRERNSKIFKTLLVRKGFTKNLGIPIPKGDLSMSELYQYRSSDGRVVVYSGGGSHCDPEIGKR